MPRKVNPNSSKGKASIQSMKNRRPATDRPSPSILSDILCQQVDSGLIAKTARGIMLQRLEEGVFKRLTKHDRVDDETTNNEGEVAKNLHRFERSFGRQGPTYEEKVQISKAWAIGNIRHVEGGSAERTITRLIECGEPDLVQKAVDATFNYFLISCHAIKGDTTSKGESLETSRDAMISAWQAVHDNLEGLRNSQGVDTTHGIHRSSAPGNTSRRRVSGSNAGH